MAGKGGTAAVPGGTSTVPSPRTNIGLDANTALLFSGSTPQGAKGGDYKAVWACEPDRFVPGTPQLLIYFHGNDYFVTAKLENGTVLGRRPDWWTKATSKVDKTKASGDGQGPCGHYYKFDVMDSLVSSSVTNLPLALLPEDGLPSGDTFASGTATLKDMVEDCLAALLTLTKPGSTSTYLTKALHADSMTRIFLTGHSGGGGPLFEACSSSLIANIPTTLVVYDATYISKVPQAQTFASLRNIGMGPSDNRAVIIYTPGVKEFKLNAAGEAKRKADKNAQLDDSDFEKDSSGRKVVAQWYTKKHAMDVFDTLKAKFSSAPAKMLVAPSTADALLAMQSNAIVCIETSVQHDQIPQTYYPLVLEASPAPSASTSTTPSSTPSPSTTPTSPRPTP